MEDISTLPLPLEPLAVPVWIDSSDMAKLASITEQAARLALLKCSESGSTWRGCALEVRTRNGGPASAQNPYQVHVDSLPPPLAAKHYERMTKRAPVSAVEFGGTIAMPTKIDPRAGKKISIRDWRLNILAPALEFREGTHERADELLKISQKTHIGFDGKPKKISRRTLQSWITRVKKAETVDGLIPKTREDKPSRTIICRTWDRACPLPAAVKISISEQLVRYVRGLWAAGRGWHEIEQLASSELLQASKEAGWLAAAYDRCRVGRHFVEKHSEAKILAIKMKDAKRFHDEFVPRVRRNRHGLRPMDVVYGDVHPVDVEITRADGSRATFRLIGWLDEATNDLFYTLVLLEKGKGITQAHVAASFAAMVAAWGLPRTLILDNGSEYKFEGMVQALNEFRGLMRSAELMKVFIRDEDKVFPLLDDGEPLDKRKNAVIRARPYRPASKPIEGIFGLLEKLLLSAFPGWIGGDRMNKRTHQMGKAPRPFPGTAADFEAKFDEAMRYWRTRGRGAVWGGRSIDQVRDDFNRDGGRRPYAVAPEALVFAMSETFKRKVTTTGIEVGGNDQWYRSPETIKLVGQRVTVRYAKWAPDYIFVSADEGASWVCAPLEPVFGKTDPAGAVHQAQMSKILDDHIRGLKATTEKVEALAEMKRHTDEVGLNVPVLTGPEIELSGDALAAVEAARLPMPQNEGIHLGYGEVLDKTGNVFSLIPDHFSANHPPQDDFDDEPDFELLVQQIRKSEGLDEAATSPSPYDANRKTGTTR